MNGCCCERERVRLWLWLWLWLWVWGQTVYHCGPSVADRGGHTIAMTIKRRAHASSSWLLLHPACCWRSSPSVKDWTQSTSRAVALRSWTPLLQSLAAKTSASMAPVIPPPHRPRHLRHPRTHPHPPQPQRARKTTIATTAAAAAVVGMGVW